jgi:poly(3-hydroxybutyrate) depolymerase
MLDEGVDPRRIYVMGWSNGGFFGQLLAIARHAGSSAGYRVAAAAVFASADPSAGVERDPRTDELLPEREP